MGTNPHMLECLHKSEIFKGITSQQYANLLKRGRCLTLQFKSNLLENLLVCASAKTRSKIAAIFGFNNDRRTEFFNRCFNLFSCSASSASAARAYRLNPFQDEERRLKGK